MWSVRNFIYSEFKSKVEERFNVYYLVPEVNNLQSFFKSYGKKVIFYPIQKFSSFEDILYIALKYKSLKIESLKNNHEFFRSYLKPPNVLKAKMKDWVGLLLSKILPVSSIEKLLITFSSTVALKRLSVSIVEIDPYFILATNHIVKYEIKIFSFFQKYKYNTRLYVNSFDNLTSRGILPLRYFDHYFVWNDKMTSELKEYYNIPNTKISKVSTPQFDLLFEGANERLDKSDAMYDLVENTEFLLYSTGHFSLLPEEPGIVEKFVEKLQGDNQIKKLKIIVRPHPMEKYERWTYLSVKYNNVFIDYPWVQDPQNPNWAVPSKYEFKRLGRIISRAKIIFNIASTITLDCCILDKPVINLYFSIKPEDEIVVRNYYHLDHYKDITAANCAPRAAEENQLLFYTRLLLEKPNEYSDNRKSVRVLISDYSIDKSASEKLLEELSTAI